MNKFTIFICTVAIIGTAIAQEYDFESSAPRRPAPPRVTPGYSGSVDVKPTPVPILKQINRHNEDGSYTYGYEGADGSFKIETKLTNGEVKGKYGYVDSNGKVRVVEYGANKYGFQPAGEGITVAPPTLVDESTDKNGLPLEEDDGSYYQPAPQQAPARHTVAKAQRPRPQAPQPSYQDFSVPQHNEAPAPRRPIAIPGAAPSGVVYSEKPQFSRPAPQPQPQHFAPARPAPQPQHFAPARPAYTAPQAPQRFAPQYSRPQFEEPAPVRQQFDEDFPQPERQQYISRPQPQRQQQPIQFAPIQQRPSAGARSGSILDQLMQDYALPSNGAPALHDITFGTQNY
ncbi:translation initiation factor IF-2-like [Chrysoperla carnea]|uniref:translation initiation factor IF-2-like n=1 Tax=Chrysoperla carnea TaxID=189513 RepID=UPI001D0931D3|nr:translation initiation factor IF-2-like [Chrysoperla carnea]